MANCGDLWTIPYTKNVKILTFDQPVPLSYYLLSSATLHVSLDFYIFPTIKIDPLVHVPYNKNKSNVSVSIQ